MVNHSELDLAQFYAEATVLVTTFLLAAIVGYRLDGMDGMYIGAALGWFVPISVAMWINSVDTSRRSAEMDQQLEKLDDILQAINELGSKFDQQLPRSQKYYTALLDSLPTDNHSVLSTRTSGIPDQDGRVADQQWAIIRRHLTTVLELDETLVDALRMYVMFGRDSIKDSTKWPPRSLKNLEDIVEQVKAEFKVRPLTNKDMMELAEVLGLDPKEYEAWEPPHSHE